MRDRIMVDIHHSDPLSFTQDVRGMRRMIMVDIHHSDPIHTQDVRKTRRIIMVDIHYSDRQCTPRRSEQCVTEI